LQCFTNDYFTIERSQEGNNFEALAKINGAGNSIDQKEYSFKDDMPLSGISYYRLRQTDFDGHSTVSDIVMVNKIINKTLKLISYRIDENRLLRISFYDKKKQSFIRIFEISGRELFSTPINYPEGFNKLNLQVPFLSSGSYILMISNGDESVYGNILIEN
jgi:hypothetical protein